MPKRKREETPATAIGATTKREGKKARVQDAADAAQFTPQQRDAVVRAVREHPDLVERIALLEYVTLDEVHRCVVEHTGKRRFGRQAVRHVLVSEGVYFADPWRDQTTGAQGQKAHAAKKPRDKVDRKRTRRRRRKKAPAAAAEGGETIGATGRET